MPLYEYRCRACDHQFEVMQKLSDRPIRKCEKCGRLKAKRIISQTSFVLKGSGWYTTDYGGRKSGTARDKSEDQPAAKESSDSGSGASTDEPSKKAASA